MIMDVEKLKKMNVLADTLKSHGLAATREDAANLAGDLVGSPEEQEFSNGFIPDEPVAEEAPTSVEPIPEEPAYNEEQMKKILQNFADQFCEQINKMETRLQQQDEQIESFKRVLETKNEDTPQVEETEAPAIPAEPITQTAPVQPQTTPAPVQSPRSGGYDSNDVSIEKFFYCGQK